MGFRKNLLSLIDCPNSLGQEVVNSLIMAGDAFFATLLGMGATGLLQDWKLGLVGAGISAGFTFFSTLAIQRGLKKSE